MAEGVMAQLQAAGVPAGVVQNARDCLEDEHLAARGYYQYLEHPEAGRTAYDGSGFHLSKTPAQFTSAANCLGEHNFQVATEILGVSPEEFAELVAEQVLY
jgi:crotonobetainyl-CoA:carnitine CoA-transferase CaiB-like acyl-CoA transferase